MLKHTLNNPTLEINGSKSLIGSGKYIGFIEKELQPYIKENSSAGGRRTIIGESLAGLLAAEILTRKIFFTNLNIPKKLNVDNAMRKVIAAINTTLDGICDHTAGIPDDELHQHYTDLLTNADTILYGRITYQLMEYWRTLLENPSDEKSMNDFAVAIDRIPKIVFSRTLNNVDWNSAKLASQGLKDEILELKQQPGEDILVGSRSLIIQLMKLNLIDEYQLCIHPVIAGGGSPLFGDINDRTVFKLRTSKVFSSGAIALYYEPATRNI